MREGIKILIALVVLCYSCKTVTVNNDNQIISDSQPQLGAIGFLESRLVLEKEIKRHTFKTVMLPSLESKIRLELHKEKFDKKRYTAYLNTSPKNEYQVSYIDSISTKPEFLSLQLSDRLEYIEHLKGDVKLINYLKDKPELQSVTSISIVVKPELVSFFNNAESIFLVYDKKLKEYHIELMEYSGAKQKVYFNDVIVFAFNTSGFCWGANYKRQVELKMLSDGGCSKGLKKKATRVNIEKDYLNF
ncbi:hypothetical protein [Joostella sp. CR20]|uniref:hypothetical protein n=1 Tax=Joostella sp. CR20 TaxID=2804312 RepID=UPI00313C34A5